MSTWEEKPITVYRVIDTELVVCSLSETHEVKLVARKFLGPVVAERSHDNGYGWQLERVRLDAQGREYESRSPIDFYGSTSWWRAVDKVHWDSRPPYQTHRFLAPTDIGIRLTLVLSS